MLGEDTLERAGKHRMTRSVRPWRGTIRLAPGVGIFSGEAGDNETHVHAAHQVSVGLDRPIVVVLHGGTVRARAAFVPAACPHRVSAGRMLAVYAEPSSDLGIALATAFSPDGQPCSIPATTAHRLVAIADAAGDVVADIVRVLADLVPADLGPVAPQPAFVALVRKLTATLRGGAMPSRGELAQFVSLSESRFSHWFREQAGMPMQSFRKWLRLTLAIERVLAGEAMASAATHAGFADQAHFVRTFRAMFGVSPTAGLRGGHRS